MLDKCHKSKIDDELIGGYNQLVEYFEKQGKVNFKVRLSKVMADDKDKITISAE